MHFRWTIKELKEKTDKEILKCLVYERQTSCTNMYAPLYCRLAEIYSKLDKEIEEERKNS